MADWLQKQWVGYSIWQIFLLPLSFIFFALSVIRKILFQLGVFRVQRLPVPVIVVGNISVGGTGKTPLVIWLAEQLQQAGFKPGIISRGYGGSATGVCEVFEDSLPHRVGDEPLLLAKRTRCPVFIGTHRVGAGLALLKAHPEVNVMISDDGLQHYRLHRDVEIAVVDAQRGFGNGLLLPAGPLREARCRLNSVDAVVMTNTSLSSSHAGSVAPVFDMRLAGSMFISLFDGKSQQAAEFFKGKALVALAGIGNPKRFFDTLSGMGLDFDHKSFADHHAFTPQDLLPFVGKTILMTEKDAVKCERFLKGDAQHDIWVLPVSANIESGLKELVLQKLATEK